MIHSSAPVTRREWLAVFGLALAVLCLTAWPALSGIWNQPAGTTYLGTNIPDVLDSQVYYAFIQANADGQTLYRNQFTSTAQPAVLFNPLWWALGRVAALSGWTPVTVFWLAKAVFGIVLLAGLYRVIAVFFPEARWRLLGFILAVFGGGLGWFWLLGLTAHPGLIWAYQDPNIVSALPVDLTYSAGYVWMSILHSPLYVFSIGLLLWIGWAAWQSRSSGRWIHAAGAGILLLGLIHPYDVVVAVGVGISFVVIGILGNLADQALVKKFLRQAGQLALWSVPALVYYGWLVGFVPALKEWNNQNVLMTSNLRTVVAGFAPTIFFVTIGIRHWWSTDRGRVWLPLAWVSAAGALLYVPILQYQAKMIIGLSIPMAILATAGIQTVVASPRWRRPIAAMVLSVMVALAIMTPVFFLTRFVQAQHAEPQRFYMSNDLASSLRWIRQTTPPDAVVLGDVWTGNLVPQYAGRATWIGHHHQTGDFEKKLALERDWFFQDNNHPTEKITWLQAEGIDYLVEGPNERRQGSFDPAVTAGLDRVFSTPTVAVWHVRPALGE